jgi:hypothetical protein
MQLVDKNGNIFGAGIEITSPDGKPKTTGGGGGSPTGPAGGDLSGIYPNPGVVWANGLPTYDLQYYPLTNPSGFITSSALGPYLTAATAASTYQPILVSATNIKTVNGNSLLGSGDITVSSGVTLVTKKTNISATGGGMVLIASHNISSYVGEGMLQVTAMYRKTLGPQAYVPRLYVNNSASLTGATLIATLGTITVLNHIADNIVNFSIDSSNNLYATNVNGSLFSRYNAAAGTVVALPSPCYLIWAGQLTNSADIAVLLNSNVIKYA